MRKVRVLPAPLGRTPAITLTAYARAVDRQQAMMAGYHLHIGKPVDPVELVIAVARLTGRGSG